MLSKTKIQKKSFKTVKVVPPYYPQGSDDSRHSSWNTFLKNLKEELQSWQWTRKQNWTNLKETQNPSNSCSNWPWRHLHSLRRNQKVSCLFVWLWCYITNYLYCHSRIRKRGTDKPTQVEHWLGDHLKQGATSQSRSSKSTFNRSRLTNGWPAKKQFSRISECHFHVLRTNRFIAF